MWTEYAEKLEANLADLHRRGSHRHPDPAGSCAQSPAGPAGRCDYRLGDRDGGRPQVHSTQVRKLANADVVVAPSNASAAAICLAVHANISTERYRSTRIAGSLHLEADGNFLCIGHPSICEGPLN